MAHPGGRPSEYTPEVLNTYKEYIAEAIPQNMKIPSVEGLALKIGTYKTTLYRWAKANKEFRYALSELKKKQKEYLTEIGIFGGKEVNASIVALFLRANHGMVETTHTDITSKGRRIYPKPIADVQEDHSDKEDTLT